MTAKTQKELKNNLETTITKIHGNNTRGKNKKNTSIIKCEEEHLLLTFPKDNNLLIMCPFHICTLRFLRKGWP